MKEKKRKSFWKGRLGIGIIAVVAFMMLTTGVVYAYDFFTAEAEITVDECMTVANTGGDDGEQMNFSPNKWVTKISPGSSKSLNLLITNIGTGTIVVTPSDGCSAKYTKVTAAWTTSGDYSFVTGESGTFTLTVTVLPDAPPQAYAFGITIAR